MTDSDRPRMRRKERVSFDDRQIQGINTAVEQAEEIIADHYKLSASQLLRLNYDVKTLADLSENEIVDGHFAQIIRYTEKKNHTMLDAGADDFYKICLQDHCILRALERHRELDLLAFALYIVSHELIHIIRFRRFLQKFDATSHERMAEERRVHFITHEILSRLLIGNMAPVLKFYENWRHPPHELGKP